MGYLAVADQTITITEGTRTGVSLVDEAATGSLVITKTDDQGAALGGACFTVGDQSRLRRWRRRYRQHRPRYRFRSTVSRPATMT